MSDEQNRHIRWWAIAVVIIIGLGITALPFFLSDRLGAEYGTRESLASSALTNVGTAILLVAVVFLVERGLVRRVREAAEQRATAVVDERTQELTDATRALNVRIDALQAQLEERVAEVDSQRLARVGRLSAEVSFDTVADALEQANDLGGLASGDITVPAGVGLDAPRITLSWRPHFSSSGWDEHEDGDPRMTLRYKASRNPDGGIGVPVVEVDWSPLESPVQVMHTLRDEMRRRGFGSEAKLVGDALFTNLHEAIFEALAARMDADGAWAHGAMCEWLADGWAITDRGLTSRDHGIVESDEFPESSVRGIRRTGSNQPAGRFRRPAPDGVDPSFWAQVVERAQKYHPRGGDFNFGLGGSRPPAYTPSTSPRKLTGWPGTTPDDVSGNGDGMTV